MFQKLQDSIETLTAEKVKSEELIAELMENRDFFKKWSEHYGTELEKAKQLALKFMGEVDELKGKLKHEQEELSDQVGMANAMKEEIQKITKSKKVHSPSHSRNTRRNS